MEIFLTLLGILAILAISLTVADLLRDGRGHTPAVRSHEDRNRNEWSPDQWRNGPRTGDSFIRLL